MEPPCRNLGADGDDKNSGEDHGADQIAKVQRHRDGVSAGLAQGRCEYLDDSEPERDRWNFALGTFGNPIHEVFPSGQLAAFRTAGGGVTGTRGIDDDGQDRRLA